MQYLWRDIQRYRIRGPRDPSAIFIRINYPMAIQQQAESIPENPEELPPYPDQDTDDEEQSAILNDLFVR